MNIKLILKGFIVGIGKILPGISGSLLAMTLGIYESLLEAVTNFFNNPKKHLKILLNFGLGVIASIILFSKLILFLLNNYYYETMYLFIGLIIGTLIPFTKNLKINIKNISIFLFTLFISYFINIFSLPSFTFTGSLLNYIYASILGIIDAFTSIIPGISGTAIFMSLGVYEYVLSILANPLSFIFLIYSIGLILGIVIVCFLMHYLLKKHKELTYTIVFAFMCASIITLLLKIISVISLPFIIVLVAGLIIGIIFDS